jgi:hypothetical protein
VGHRLVPIRFLRLPRAEELFQPDLLLVRLPGVWKAAAAQEAVVALENVALSGVDQADVGRVRALQERDRQIMLVM